MNNGPTEASGESQVMFKEAFFQCYSKYSTCIPLIQILKKNMHLLYTFLNCHPKILIVSLKLNFLLGGDMKY